MLAKVGNMAFDKKLNCWDKYNIVSMLWLATKMDGP